MHTGHTRIPNLDSNCMGMASFMLWWFTPGSPWTWGWVTLEPVCMRWRSEKFQPLPTVETRSFSRRQSLYWPTYPGSQ